MEQVDKLVINEEFLLAVIANDLDSVKRFHLSSFDNQVLIDAAGIILSQGFDEMREYLRENNQKFAYLFRESKPEFYERYKDVKHTHPLKTT